MINLSHKPYLAAISSGRMLLQRFWLILNPNSTILLFYLPIEQKIIIVTKHNKRAMNFLSRARIWII